MMDFDYVIVGAGAAGCVLASRLSEDPGNQVLLLEHGGRDANPLLYPPEGFYFTLRGNRYAYHYPTRPIGPGGQVEAWLRGKVLGGSTAVNGMMWTAARRPTGTARPPAATPHSAGCRCWPPTGPWARTPAMSSTPAAGPRRHRAARR